MNTKRYVRKLRENISKPQYENIVIKSPPIKEKVEQFDWLSGGIQCLVSVLNFSIVSFILAKDINITLLCAVISAAGSFVSSVATYFVKKHNVKKLNSQNKHIYWKYLDDIQSKLDREISELRDFYNTNYPDVAACLKIVENESNQLWDRQLLNNDFLLLNIGKIWNKEFEITIPECEEYVEYSERLNLIKRKEYVEDIPRLISVKHNIIGIIGEDEYINSVRDNLFIDIFTHHAYTDIKIIYLDKYYNNEHLTNSRYTYNFSEKINLVENKEKEIRTIIIWLKKTLENRHNSLLTDEESAVPFPFYILFVSRDILSKEDELLFCRYSKESIAFSVVFLYKYVELLPEVIDITIECTSEKMLIHNNKDNPLPCKHMKLNKDYVDLFIYKINQIQSIESIDNYKLLQKISIYEGYHLRRINDLKVDDYWNANENLNTLKVPIGIDEKGEDVVLDISENADGPHGIIAGTTGSGKSELIKTIILSMAINYSPQKINFILIDFKGGILANSLKDLPQVKKTLTNLDDKVKIELEYLREELKRRQSILVQSRENNINSYNEKYFEKKIPILIIIVDEFAEMKVNYPEYMKDIMSIARVGRALGVHLLLSTQRPLGVIDEQIYSNSRYKICLRVNNEFESHEMLKSPVASKIQYPGRGFIQIADSTPRMFQVFWSDEYDHDGIIADTQSSRIVKHIKNFVE